MAHGEYNHIEIPYDDEERAKRFYSGVFGWQFSQMGDFAGYDLYTAGPGQLGGGLGKRGESAGTTTRNYILVDSIDDAVKKVVELGGTITTPKDEIPGMGWYAAGTDSEGNTLALYETAAKG
jgi:predicted enzyme related to lactoylglutathione lyase